MASNFSWVPLASGLQYYWSVACSHLHSKMPPGSKGLPTLKIRMAITITGDCLSVAFLQHLLVGVHLRSYRFP